MWASECVLVHANMLKCLVRIANSGRESVHKEVQGPNRESGVKMALKPNFVIIGWALARNRHPPSEAA